MIANRATFVRTFPPSRNGNWIWPLLAALALNLVLFGLMPWLQSTESGRPVAESPVSQVNVVRIKRAETPPRPKEERPPEAQPRKVKPRLNQTVVKPVSTKLTLPFEINTRLPAAPSDLTLPELEIGASTAPGAEGLEGVFEGGDLDAPLMVLTRMPPLYPLRAKSRGIEGWVKVRFLVNEQGGVSDVSIVSAEPRDIFEQSVVRCVSGWRFRPGTIEGVPVKAWAETTIRFELQ